MTVKATTPITDPLNHAAQLEEYKTLRTQIDIAMSQMSTVERWVMVGIAAVWAWLSASRTLPASKVSEFAWWIPLFLAVSGAAQSWALRRDIGFICRYLQSELEERLSLRWEQWYGNQRGARPRLGMWYWTFLVGLTATVAFWQFLRHTVIVGG